MPPFRLRRTRRRPLRIVLIAVGAALVVATLVATVFTLSLYYAYDSKRHVVTAFPAATDRPARASGAAAGAMNVLVLGTDVDSVDSESPQFIGKREADTVALLHISADRSKVYMVSILRNSLVDVPGHGRQAINSAYAFGGVPLTVQTVEQLLDVRVDHVVDVSLNGLRGLTDALGGVEVHTATTFTNDGITFPAGTTDLDGTRALSYLRAGDFRAQGDSTRASAQEAYFRGLLQQVLSAKVLLDPPALAASVNVISPYLTTDRGFDSAAVVALGASLRNLRSSDLVTVRVADDGITTVDGATAVNLDAARLKSLSAALRDDSMADYTG